MKRAQKLIELAQTDEEKFKEELEKIQDIEEAPDLVMVEHLEGIHETLEKLIEAVQNIPEPKDVDFSSAESEIRMLQDTIRESVANIPQPESVDFSPLTQGLSNIVSSIDRMEPADLLNVESLLAQMLLALKREGTDYTPHLEAIQDALKSLQTKEREDYGPFLIELEKVLKRSLNINVSSGGSSKLHNALGIAINPATQEKQDEIITAINGISVGPGGSGVQYTEGDTDATITGTAALVEGAANALVPMTQPLTDTQLRATPVPVSGTFWQATQPVSLATVPSHDVTNAGTFAVQVTSAPSTVVTATQLDVDNLNATDDVVTVTGGAGQTADVKVTLDGESVPVTGTFWQTTQPVSIASAVPVTDNSGSLTVDNNGTFAVQATLAAETTKVIGTVNVAVGQTIATTNAGTFAVQQSTYSTSSVTSVAGSASSVQLLASTAGRRGAYFYNDSTAIAYLKLGTTASTSSFTVAMAANSFYELPYPCYTGRIDCIWASATGNMRITEIT